MITNQQLRKLQIELLQATKKAEQAKAVAEEAKAAAEQAKAQTEQAKAKTEEAKTQTEEAKKLNEISAVESRKRTEEINNNIQSIWKRMEGYDRKMEAMGFRLGSIGQNQGDVAEEFFYNSLDDAPILGGIQYDFKDKSWRNRVGQVQDEFDIVLVNGQHIAIIEVKYKAHHNDLEKLLTKKINNFKILFPQYTGFEYHLALASLNINDDLKQSALKSGVIVLQRNGDIMESFLPC
jgi:chromosome segregation ATPase